VKFSQSKGEGGLYDLPIMESVYILDTRRAIEFFEMGFADIHHQVPQRKLGSYTYTSYLRSRSKYGKSIVCIILTKFEELAPMIFELSKHTKVRTTAKYMSGRTLINS
jgi:hypothetical protein